MLQESCSRLRILSFTIGVKNVGAAMTFVLTFGDVRARDQGDRRLMPKHFRSGSARAEAFVALARDERRRVTIARIRIACDALSSATC
jgi:hypothetical protein